MSQITCDLSNATGVVLGQPFNVLDQFPDTTTFEFTTNTFQAFDQTLTPGTNLFTFHATDLAGNVSSINYTVMCASTAPYE